MTAPGEDRHRADFEVEAIVISARLCKLALAALGAGLLPSTVFAECDSTGLPSGVSLVEMATPTGPRCVEVYADDSPQVTLQATTTSCDLTAVEWGNEVVELLTPLGAICVELFPLDAPLHVENFLHYVGSGAMAGTFFHRTLPGFVLQGGGFRVGPGDYEAIPATNGTVQNEPCTRDMPSPDNGLIQVCSERGNERGTVALAKLGNDPNSGSTNWFINLADNRTNLDNQNGGFTVFGQVISEDMVVVDAIAALPTATDDDLAWMESALQAAGSPFPLMQAPLDTAADTVGCWNPASQVTVLNENMIPNIAGLSPDPVNPTLPFMTLSTDCGSPFAGAPSEFIGNPTPGGDNGCPFDVIAIETTGPRSLAFPGGVQSLWTLDCASQQQTLVDRAVWQATFQTHFNDQLVVVLATTIEPTSVVPAMPPVVLALLAVGLMGAAGTLLRRGTALG